MYIFDDECDVFYHKIEFDAIGGDNMFKVTVPDGTATLYVERILYNLNNGGAKPLVIGVFTNGKYYPFYQEKIPSTDHLSPGPASLILTPKMELFCNIKNALLGDKITLYIYGYRKRKCGT